MLVVYKYNYEEFTHKCIIIPLCNGQIKGKKGIQTSCIRDANRCTLEKFLIQTYK